MHTILDANSASPPTIFVGKWTVIILTALREGPHRHGQLRRRVGNVSQRVLTRTLRNLEDTGLVVRRQIAARPLAVEYSLTPLGRSFVAPLTSMCRWASRHHKSLSATVQLAGLRAPRTMSSSASAITSTRETV